MHPIVTLLLIALIAFAVIAVIALIPTFIVMFASKKFALQQHAQLKARITEQLPGTDCGCCGCGTCGEFACRLIEGETEYSHCTSLAEGNTQQLQEILEEWNRERQRQQTASEELEVRRKKHRPF